MRRGLEVCFFKIYVICNPALSSLTASALPFSSSDSNNIDDGASENMYLLRAELGEQLMNYMYIQRTLFSSIDKLTFYWRDRAEITVVGTVCCFSATLLAPQTALFPSSCSAIGED